MEFIELNCLCKHIKRSVSSSQDSIFRNSCIEFLLKFFPESIVKSKRVFLKIGVINVSGNEVDKFVFSKASG